MNEVGDVSSLFAIQLSFVFLLILPMISKTKPIEWRNQKLNKTETIIFILLALHFLIRCFIRDDEPTIGTGFTSSKWMAAMAEGLVLNYGVFIMTNKIIQIGTTRFPGIRIEESKKDNFPQL